MVWCDKLTPPHHNLFHNQIIARVKAKKKTLASFPAQRSTFANHLRKEDVSYILDCLNQLGCLSNASLSVYQCDGEDPIKVESRLGLDIETQSTN